jgi:uncharacterized membrane protein (UPF0182 family)
VERYSELLESRFVRVMVALGLVVGLFAGGAVSGHVLEYLAWRNSTSFNVTDPRFGLYVGFFVFDYPWWRLVCRSPSQHSFSVRLSRPSSTT